MLLSTTAAVCTEEIDTANMYVKMTLTKHNFMSNDVNKIQRMKNRKVSIKEKLDLEMLKKMSPKLNFLT